jgi:hypothetical protein
VVSGNKLTKQRSRLGGIYDLVGLTDHTGRFERWLEDASQNKGRVYPQVEATGQITGLPQRRTFICPKCKKEKTHKNSTLLERLLDALASGESEIFV